MTTSDGRSPSDDSLAALAVRTEFAARDMDGRSDRYQRTSSPVLFEFQAVSRAAARSLTRLGALPFTNRRILDVGCGSGGWLMEFESWGARRELLAGVDLLESRVSLARHRLAWADHDGVAGPGADIRVADAQRLPFPDHSFDIVTQFTVLSSLGADSARQVAREMLRVLAPSGVVLSYDFAVPNPFNRKVRAVRRRDLQTYFEAARLVYYRRVTLAPPLTRLTVPASWLIASALQSSGLLNTHSLAVLRRDVRIA